MKGTHKIERVNVMGRRRFNKAKKVTRWTRTRFVMGRYT